MDNLDPTIEFADDTVEPKAPPSAPPAASAAEVAALKQELAQTIASNRALSEKTAVLDRLSEALAPSAPGKRLDAREQGIRDEILRLVPEIQGTNKDLTAVKGLLPTIIETVGATAEERGMERSVAANDELMKLMEGVGLDPKDPEAVGYMELALVGEIRKSADLKRMWDRGQIKNAVTKAFDKVQSKLIAPVRVGAKRAAVTTIADSPKATLRGGTLGSAPAGGSAPAVLDLTDTSRAGLNKIADAAFDRLQDLMKE